MERKKQMVDDQIPYQFKPIMPSWRQILSIWWWLTWRAFLALLGIIFICSFFATMLGRTISLSPEGQNIIETYGSGLIFHLTVFYLIKRLFNSARFKGFSIVLVEVTNKGYGSDSIH